MAGDVVLRHLLGEPGCFGEQTPIVFLRRKHQEVVFAFLFFDGEREEAIEEVVREFDIRPRGVAKLSEGDAQQGRRAQRDHAIRTRQALESGAQTSDEGSVGEKRLHGFASVGVEIDGFEKSATQKKAGRRQIALAKSVAADGEVEGVSVTFDEGLEAHGGF